MVFISEISYRPRKGLSFAMWTYKGGEMCGEDAF